MDNTSTFVKKSDKGNYNSKQGNQIILKKFSLEHLNKTMDNSNSCDSDQSLPYFQSFVKIIIERNFFK